MPDFDVLFIGAGHNALVCAGYLAKAGYRVGMLERRAVAGGAVVTEEHIPGYRFDLGGSAHILIHHTPIVQELDLARYGLAYIDLDPLFYAPYPDGTHLTVWRDVDRTADSIAAVSGRDAEAYRRFVSEWRAAAGGMVEAFLHPPTPLNLGRYLVLGSGKTDGWQERLADLLSGYGDLLCRYFESRQLRALIAWMAAQSGPPPAEPFSAPFALWHPMYHASGVKRPRGGSGMLTQALSAMVTDHGGQIHLSSPVRSVLVEQGRAAGAETEDGRRFTARAVVSGAHLHTTIALLPHGSVSHSARESIARTRTGNGFGMAVRYAMRGLPDYSTTPSNGDGHPGLQHRALQLICPDLDYLNRAYADYLSGSPSREPGLIAMTFSAVDPTLAPRDGHVLFLWGQYYPYTLASGESWDDIGAREADRMLSTLARYAPNVADLVVGRLIETPAYLQQTLGLLHGNVMHLAMSVNQMFMLRPTLSLSRYRGPIPGLYLTGASTHPGGGIMGAAGMNTAAAVLHDLSRRPWQFWKRSKTAGAASFGTGQP